jgi:FkbM family methyltransferase
MNELENHSIVPFALSNNRGAAELMLNGETDVSATIASGVHGDNHFRNSRQVLVTTGDEIIPSILQDDAPVALIKIDVEGAELEVLQGLDNSVERYRPVIIFELWPLDENHGLQDDTGADLSQILNERRRRTRAIEQYFAAKKYSFFKMHQSGVLAERESLFEDHIDNPHDLNFLAVPREESKHYQGVRT